MSPPDNPAPVLPDFRDLASRIARTRSDFGRASSAKATSRLSLQLAAGIRRLEGLLFPFAKPRAELPSVG